MAGCVTIHVPERLAARLSSLRRHQRRAPQREQTIHYREPIPGQLPARDGGYLAPGGSLAQSTRRKALAAVLTTY